MIARIPNYVLTTFAIVAVIILVGLYDNQRQPVADGSVGLVVGVPANQLMTQRNGVIALPGGMVDAGEIVSATVRREFAEEVLNLPSEARAARVHTRSECTSTAATL